MKNFVCGIWYCATPNKCGIPIDIISSVGLRNNQLIPTYKSIDYVLVLNLASIIIIVHHTKKNWNWQIIFKPFW